MVLCAVRARSIRVSGSMVLWAVDGCDGGTLGMQDGVAFPPPNSRVPQILELHQRSRHSGQTA